MAEPPMAVLRDDVVDCHEDVDASWTIWINNNNWFAPLRRKGVPTPHDLFFLGDSPLAILFR
jgi:hypothetical protein